MSDFPQQPVSTRSEAPPPPADGRDATSPSSGAPSAPTSTTSDPGSRVEEAKGEARQVADTAVASGTEVAATARDEAQNVAAETKQQAASLLATVRSEVGQQASSSQSRIAEALHGLSKELGSMASTSQESGPLTDLAHQASRKGGEIAHWLQDREPSDVLEEARSFARRRPGTFLVVCGLAGVVAGRLTRGAVASRTSVDSHDQARVNAARPAIGDDYPAARPDFADVSPSDRSTSVAEPAGGGSPGQSTGVYGGSLETTESPGGAEPDGDPTPGSGFVGTTSGLDDPESERNR